MPAFPKKWLWVLLALAFLVPLLHPILPDLVKRRGISVKKKSPNVLMIINLFATDEGGRNRRTDLQLSNYATIQIRDELSRIEGVGDVTYLGQRDYSMRIWLDPEKLTAKGLSANDIINAIESQNMQRRSQSKKYSRTNRNDKREDQRLRIHRSACKPRNLHRRQVRKQLRAPYGKKKAQRAARE